MIHYGMELVLCRTKPYRELGRGPKDLDPFFINPALYNFYQKEFSHEGHHTCHFVDMAQPTREMIGARLFF